MMIFLGVLIPVVVPLVLAILVYSKSIELPFMG
jgi:hypothetical protein